jgi:hypothetical protein
MTSDVQSAENQSASRTPKFSRENVKNVGVSKTTEDKITIEVRAPPRILDVRVFYMDKDGTNYDLLVIEIEGNFSFGSMSMHKHGYLVLEGLNRRAYIFHDFIPDGRYIAEKLSGGHDLTGRDIENIMLLMKQGMKPKRLKTFQESVQDATRARVARPFNKRPLEERERKIPSHVISFDSRGKSE